MKGSTVNRGAKIRNYAIALVLLIIGILPFIYLLIESFAGYDGHYLFDGRFVNGIEGIFYVAWFYLAFFFPIFAIAFLIIVSCFYIQNLSIEDIILIVTIAKK